MDHRDGSGLCVHSLSDPQYKGGQANKNELSLEVDNNSIWHCVQGICKRVWRNYLRPSLYSCPGVIQCDRQSDGGSCGELCDAAEDHEGMTGRVDQNGCPIECCICDRNIQRHINDRGYWPNPEPIDPAALELIYTCIGEHESQHTLTPNEGGANNISCYECAGYQREVNCLRQHVEGMNGPGRVLIETRLRIFECLMRQYCATCALGHAPDYISCEEW